MTGLVKMFLAVFLAGATLTAAVDLPEGITKCKNDNTVNDCILKVAVKAIPALAKGNRKFKIPVLDPLRIDRLEMKEGDPKHNFVNVVFTNMDLVGIKGAKLTKSEVSTKTKTLKWQFSVKPIKISSNYEMTGKFLLVPVTGKGKANIEIEQGTFDVNANYTLEKRNGKDFVKMSKPKLTYNITKAKFHFDNLFNGDKALGDNVNQMLNDNWREVNSQFGPALAEAIKGIIYDILIRINKVVPYGDMYIK